MKKKRIVRENMTREQKIREALGKKKKINRWGMTAEQIKESFRKNNKQQKSRDRVHKSNEKRKVVSISETQRPKKAAQPAKQDASIALLLEAPYPNVQGAIQYPTPKWFTNTKKVDVSVIVPLYKSAELVTDLLNTWDHENDGLKVEIVFVDDSCPANSKEAVLRHCEKIRDRFKKPFARIFYNPQNQGFGTTCNTGAYHALGDYLIFLNSDTTLTKSWIKPMTRLFKDEEVGMVGNLQIKEGGTWHGTIDGAGSEWHWNDTTFHHIGRHSYNGKTIQAPFHPQNCPQKLLKKVSEREMVTGCCFTMKKSFFDEIGGFDPNYRIGYWEDSDLCMRVREKGYKILYTPNSVINHKLSQSGSGGHKYQSHNKKFFENKWINTGRIDSIVKAPRPQPMKAIKSILIKRETANGDVLAATAVAPALKKKYPEAKIYFSTNHPKVIEENPHIDGYIQNHELVDRRFQIYFNLDMAYEQRPKSNIVECYADCVGVKTEDCKTFIKQEHVDKVPDNFIVIHAGKTNWVGRDWSKSKFDIISNRLMQKGFNVVSIGHGGDYSINCTHDFRNKTNIHQLAYLIDKSKFFVGIDSFPMHVAQTVEKPGVCFFGSILPETRIYFPKMVGVNAVDLKCLGCHHNKPAPSTVTNKCATGTLDCINMVSINQMMNAIEKGLKENDIYS